MNRFVMLAVAGIALAVFPAVARADDVELKAAGPDDKALQTAPLTVVYRYREAPKWDGPIKVVEQQVTKNGETFRVDVPQTEKLPQMRDLTLRYGKLAWNPDEKP